MLSFEPLSPPASKCPKCLGQWVSMEIDFGTSRKSVACGSQRTCPDRNLCRELYLDRAIIIVDETEELYDRAIICNFGKFCLVCNRQNCIYRREGQEV